MSFVFTSDNGSDGLLVCVFRIFNAASETDWLSSTFSASIVEISSVLLAAVCYQTHSVHETCWAGLHLWTGLNAVRDLRCVSSTYDLSYVKRLGCGCDALSLVADDLTIDLGRLNLRHLSDSGLFVRRSLRF